jgi:hypothetical protein
LARPQDAIQDYTQAITFLEGPIQENGTHELRTFGTKDRILELEAPTNQPTNPQATASGALQNPDFFVIIKL